MWMPGASGAVHSTRTARTAHHSLILNKDMISHAYTLFPYDIIYDIIPHVSCFTFHHNSLM